MQRPRPARVPRTAEVVAAGSIFARMIRGFFALWHEIDDAEKEYGPRLYQSMMHDPAVGSCVDVLRQAAVRTPRWVPPKQLRPRPGQEMTPDQATATEIAAFLDRACKSVKGAGPRAIEDTLYEFAYGLVEDKVAEIVLRKVTSGPDAGRLTWDRWKFKPRESWRYVVDAYGNVGFIAGRLPPGEIPPDPNTAVQVPGTGGNAVLLDPDRWAVYAWATRDSDPRCRPILRRAYNAWNLKCRTWPEKLKGDIQFGTPTLIGIMPEHMEDPEPDEVQGLTFADGTAVQTAEDLFDYVLTQSANGSAGALPFGSQIHVIESTRSGESLNASIELYDRQIAMGILHASRTTLEAEHGSKADAEASGDVTDLIVALIRAGLSSVLWHAGKNLVRLNWGDDAAERLMPDCLLGESERRDLAELIPAWAKWVASGAPTQAQLAEIDGTIELTPRSPGEPSLADLRAPDPAALGELANDEDDDE